MAFVIWRMSVIISNPLDKYHKTITGLSLRCPLAYFCRKIEKIEPNKIPCCWIPFLLVSLAWQLEILTTALLFVCYWPSKELYARVEWFRCIGWSCSHQCNSVVTWDTDWRIKLYCTGTVLCLKLPKTRLAIIIGNSMICSVICQKYRKWYCEIFLLYIISIWDKFEISQVVFMSIIMYKSCYYLFIKYSYPQKLCNFHMTL